MATSSGNQRKTSRRVRIIDRLATVMITGGGVSVILAIMGICVFLVWVVVPLFRAPHVSAPCRFTLPSATAAVRPLLFDVDEYLTQGLVLHAEGQLIAFDAQTGAPADQPPLLPPDRKLTSFARALHGGHAALGVDDGSVVLAKIGFERLFDSQGSTTRPLVQLAEPMKVSESGSAVVKLDYQVQTVEERIVKESLAALTEDQSLVLAVISRKMNLLEGTEKATPRFYRLPYAPRNSRPAFLLLNEQCSNLYLAWEDGLLHRYDLRDPGEATVVEQVDLVEDDAARLTDLKFLIGTRSLLVGDSNGAVAVWFTVEDQQRRVQGDGLRLARAHVPAPHAAGITAIAASTRNRCFITADSTGVIVLRHATSDQTLLKLDTGGGQSIVECRIAPKADAIVALDAAGACHLWRLNNPHPETTLASLFGPVWYEGDAGPTLTWQSSGGSDDFEPKLSLTPLVFGTLKATVYSMLFAVPIALLGAIYSSQFLHPRQRNVIKPTIEVMASLPSVVLGFAAALVLAPVVERHITTVLALVVVIPLVVLLAGYLFQLAPPGIVTRFSSGWRLLVAVGCIALSIVLSRQVSPLLERWVFAGDILAWMDGRVGSPTPLWVVLIFPVVAPATMICHQRWIRPRLQAAVRLPSNLSEAVFELLGMAGLLLVTAGVSLLVAAALTSLGFDLRDELAGTYVQRNTLVVGFVMGFAVIPIIYTIAEDALSSVPEHLKAGSLACGASQWQTTLRVILPIAMSGIYSAVLIGLGRAVGETMIVVMAAGNTAIMDLSPFKGLRALSANIAVELPEAVKDGTLYRVLFLAGLVLFLLTFLINTVAEIIRLRLRKRVGDL